MMSRVRKSSDLRILPLQLNSFDLQHLQGLDPPQELIDWFSKTSPPSHTPASSLSTTTQSERNIATPPNTRYGKIHLKSTHKKYTFFQQFINIKSIIII